MKPKKCPNCQGELTTKQVEKILKGGVHTAILQIEAEVCLNCGEKLYKPDVVREFAQIRAKLKNRETEETPEYLAWLEETRLKIEEGVQAAAQGDVLDATEVLAQLRSKVAAAKRALA